jgi:hypothetical protein
MSLAPIAAPVDPNGSVSLRALTAKLIACRPPGRSRLDCGGRGAGQRRRARGLRTAVLRFGNQSLAPLGNFVENTMLVVFRGGGHESEA